MVLKTLAKSLSLLTLTAGWILPGARGRTTGQQISIGKDRGQRIVDILWPRFSLAAG